LTSPVVRVQLGGMGVERGGCTWPGTDTLYCEYHDTEWGVPEYDDRALFEKLVLDGFQAGLSWITILRKRAAFREAFDGFAPEVIARYDAEKVERLLGNSAIVRSRLKVNGAIKNARGYLAIMEHGSFAQYLWGFVDGKPVQNRFRTMKEVPTQTAMSTALSKDLKRRGFTFCGPVIVYAFAQAVGLVNDHMVDCQRHAECARLGRAGFAARR
jgi:DNA-3-methyladenine glycosylase I